MKGAQRGTAALVAAMIALTLAACAPDPAPPPTPTGFASEEEAFAAAEATYRAYVDALNGVQFDDPSTFEGTFAWTTGAANAADRKDFSQYHADKMTLDGDFAVASFAPDSWDPSSSNVGADACLDVSKTQILDANGVSTVSPTRAPVVAVRVEFVAGATPTRLAIDDVSAREGEPLC